ncbi:MAG: F0F1 ATP synthase subunit A [Pelagibacteraceae bacterium TMED65]|nr:F0F1 ATP synthase subunit A [Rickettsiales bacterium]OUU51127.1 MAG: F0F1 ATP synthase subunit A [Pelagibacteraceae bacterium TMED65]
MASPLAQFEIKKIIPIEFLGHDISFTNSSLAMTITVLFILTLMFLGLKNLQIIPSKTQTIIESSYEFIANMIGDNIGNEGMKYFSFIFTLFLFILIGNLLGMFPYSFTWTSHIIVTFSIAFFIFLGVTILAIYKHGLMKFIKFFAPSGVPKPMLLLLVPIEIISYLSRPISLSVRLFANMMAGHTLLKVIGGFVFVLGANSFIIGGILPLAFLIALTGLEIVIAFLQAYVFAILTCLYINDAIHLH